MKIGDIISNLDLSSRRSIICMTAIGGCVVYAVIKYYRNINNGWISAKNRAILITGCDSGLGYTVASHCYKMGFHVFAMVLDDQSKGAIELNSLNERNGRITIIKMDITKIADIKNAFQVVVKFLNSNPDQILHCIVNNAGVMIFGELEWLTEDMIYQQVNVNLIGVMMFTKQFLLLLRKHKGRIINISSHCAHASLPGLSVYAATKAGLCAWNDAIRIEYSKYGIKVIAFLPGSFVMQSNILSRQMDYAKKMREAMTEEFWESFGEYFTEYQNYLSSIAGEKPLQQLQDEELKRNLANALVCKYPSPFYSVYPLRYSVYHLLFRITPYRIRDYLVERFVHMPAYNK